MELELNMNPKIGKNSAKWICEQPLLHYIMNLIKFNWIYLNLFEFTWFFMDSIMAPIYFNLFELNLSLIMKKYPKYYGLKVAFWATRGFFNFFVMPDSWRAWNSIHFSCLNHLCSYYGSKLTKWSPGTIHWVAVQYSTLHTC